MDRREMMIASAAATAAAVAAGKARDAVAASPGGMQYRELGSTGEKVSIVGLGGSHIGKVKDEQEAIRIMRDGARQRPELFRQLLGLQ